MDALLNARARLCWRNQVGNTSSVFADYLATLPVTGTNSLHFTEATVAGLQGDALRKLVSVPSWGVFPPALAVVRTAGDGRGRRRGGVLPSQMHHFTRPGGWCAVPTTDLS